MESIFEQAVAFATEKHEGQTRKDKKKTPYITHPIGVADLLKDEAGITDEDVLCAAILHDTIEDTATTEEELRQCFGDKITNIVLEVTDDKSLKKGVRKQKQIEHAPHLSYEAGLVKIADKICNLRDIKHSPPPWSEERKLDYFLWARNVVNQIENTHPTLKAIFTETWEQTVSLEELEKSAL